MEKGLMHYLSLFVRGMAMGAADVIPGVSGGTVAFITGIYAELIDSLRRFDHRALQCLFKHGVAATWQHVNGNFLLAVFGGVLISLFSLAKLMSYWLAAQPILVWALFFGLILASSVLLLREVKGWNSARVTLLVVGILLAVAVSWLRPAHLPETAGVLFLAGMIAICAMILPGISGGFLLLMMGLYPTVVGAVSEFNLSLLAPLGLGCVLGLILFSHVLSWLLHRYEAATMALLTGVLIGSLNIIWPWKQTLESVQDRHGELVPLVQANVWPWDYAVLNGTAAQWPEALGMSVIGVAVVTALAVIASAGRRGLTTVKE